MKRQPVSVAVAGLGRSGWSIHCRLLQQLQERYRIQAVFDGLEERREEARQRFGCRAYEDFPSLLGDGEVELVVVALPSHLHGPCTVEALDAGKSVICEKPMATSLKEADSMIEAAGKGRGVFTVFQNRRYDPDFLAVRRVIASGKLGRIVQIRMADHGFGRRWDWQTLKKYGGGTLNNSSSHRIDQALVLMEHADPKVFCVRDRALTLGDAEDHVKVVLTASGKPTVDIEVTSACPMAQEKWLVMGTQGGLSGTSTELHWKYFRPEELPPLELDERPTPDRSYNRDTLKLYEEQWSSESDETPGELGFYLELYETLRNGKPVPVDPQTVRRQIRVLDECRRLAPV